jgi:phosphate starvation-inducible protein PhoH and related proteins
MPSATLDFETPQFLQSLIAYDPNSLRKLSERFGIHVTSREGWIKLEGSQTGIDSVQKVIQQVEQVRRQGGEVSGNMLELVMQSVSQASTERPAESILQLKLLGGPRKSPVMAKTRGQIHYLQAMREHEVVFGIGSAGTGKTFLAMAQALHVLREKQVQRVILTRPAVEAGEALGFLPGDLKEKIFPYLRPLYDAIYDLIDAEEADKLMERGIIEIAPLAYMRGRTLKNAFIILDEAQNTTAEQMFMFLTRLGEGSRCAITGDPTQIDLKKGQRSGLIEASQALRQVGGVKFVDFGTSDVVRLPVVQRIIDAYAKHRKEAESAKEAAAVTAKETA